MKNMMLCVNVKQYFPGEEEECVSQETKVPTLTQINKLVFTDWECNFSLMLNETQYILCLKDQIFSWQRGRMFQSRPFLSGVDTGAFFTSIALIGRHGPWSQYQIPELHSSRGIPILTSSGLLALQVVSTICSYSCKYHILAWKVNKTLLEYMLCIFCSRSLLLNKRKPFLGNKYLTILMCST